MTNNQQPAYGAIIVAAGRSERMGGEDKLWAQLVAADGRGRPLLAYTIEEFQACAAISRIALVLAADSIERGRELVREDAFDKVTAIVPGSARRRDSVRAGLDALTGCDWVAVHDGARPLLTRDLIERGLDAARETGAACCAVRAPDTVKEADDGFIARTVDRTRLWLAQTPQVFRRDLLLAAHEKTSGDATDDASMVEALGVKVRLFEGSPRNIKVTTPEDLAIVQTLLLRP
jgi:2-C-methyl-D-erythritol 4-phosphate cytidylyltransferase